MAKLTNCKDCGHKVSKKAKVCPSCGVKNPSNRTHGFTKFLTFVFGSFFCLVFIANLAPSRDSSAELEKARKIYFAQSSVNSVKIRLKDPASAKFREVVSVPYKLKNKTVYATCGEVNAKNSFGGYTGYKLFVGGGKVVAVEGDANFPEIWNEFCGDKSGIDVTDYLD